MSAVTPSAGSVTTISDAAAGSGGRRSRRRKTSHLKKVPETRELREQLRQRCEAVADRLDKSSPLTKDEMERVARGLLEEMGLPEGYVGWTMVMLSSSFWRESVASVPYSRRLFLLPHCLKHAEGCPADYDEFGMNCRQCGACSIADFRTQAEDLGYRVLVAEGSPVVMKIIVSGYVDAIVGVACLNVLEKAIDKILLAGIPCVAVPLLSSDCRNTSVDEEWVADAVNTAYVPQKQKSRTYVHLMRAASELFKPQQLQRLAPSTRLANVTGHDPSGAADEDLLRGVDQIAATERIAYDFLARGGKYSRPFITLAAYDALSGGRCTEPDGADAVAEIPDSVRRAAMSIEAFHKASLVHDDIEDDDGFRYGRPAVHRKYGTPTAINVGDYLIGVGYRLVSRGAAELGAESTADVLDALAAAHTRLSEGQGAELLWRDRGNRRLTPLDALKVYALKTAPAFEAALYTGMRLTGDVTQYQQPIRDFARNLGVAFQILNDLGDWQGDNYNKLHAGGDTLGGRPTILYALSLAGLDESDQQVLLDTCSPECNLPAPERIAAVRRLYEKADAFESARRLVDKHTERAEEVADAIEPEPLRRLLQYLIHTVLDRTEPADPPQPKVVAIGT